MVVKDWKIRIQSDGRPAIAFPKGRQDIVLQPEAGDIELSDEGLIFSSSRRGTTTRYECPFNELSDMSDEELRQTIYELEDTTMLRLGQMSREELEKEYDGIEVEMDE